MISIIVLFRNAREQGERCLHSLLRLEHALHLAPDACEYVLIDDCSDEPAVLALMKRFRELASARATLIRLREHRHYAFGVSLGISLARGDMVLFVSHDMVLPAPCMRTLLEVAARGGDIVRPRSQHMDGQRHLQLSPPLELRGPDDVERFSALVRKRFGDELVSSGMLIGDAVLIKRSVIDRVGVFDPRFHGFMADIDYGVRAQRAGFNVVAALGAWLHHRGGGAAVDEIDHGAKRQAVDARNVKDMKSAYEKFRAKWGADRLPDDFLKIRSADELAVLRQLPPGEYDMAPPPLRLGAGLCDIL